jgi:glucose-6-phosphate dehydrogenase assembly protein OpcA
METQSSAVALTLKRGVDAVKLERELAALWSESGGEGSPGVTRACALNLVVYAETKEERSEIDELLEGVVERHPSRAIILQADRNATEPRLEAFVSTRCQLASRGARKICGEQVTIEAGGPIIDTLSTAVSPLLVPDVPVFLWWKDIPHYEDKLFNRLAQLADRVVIDSAAFDNPHDDLIHTTRIIERGAGSLRLSDLNWGRLTAWRALVASFWDVADYRPSLDRIEKIVIEYDPPDRAPRELAPKALLGLGWLGSRLGWTIESGSKIKDAEAEFALAAGGRSFAARLVATDDTKGRDGYVTSITITSEDGNEFFVRLRPAGAKLETGARIAGSNHTVGRVLDYEARTEAERLSGELDILSRDEVFEAAARFAARLLENANRA